MQEQSRLLKAEGQGQEQGQGHDQDEGHDSLRRDDEEEAPCGKGSFTTSFHASFVLFLSMYLSIYSSLSVDLSIYLSIYLCTIDTERSLIYPKIERNKTRREEGQEDNMDIDPPEKPRSYKQPC